MKKIILLLVLSAICGNPAAFSQGPLTSVGYDPADVCFQGQVFFGAQFNAVPLEPLHEMEIRLNQAIDFARKNPQLESRPAVQFAINCRGGLGGGFHMAHSSGDAHFDEGLIEFFKTVERWRPAEINNEQVDSWILVNMVVRGGYIYITGLSV